MRTQIVIVAIIVPAAVIAADSSQVDELRVKCEKEKAALSVKNSNTPSCDRLAAILLDVEKPRKQNNDAATYQWNGGMGKYCYYNEKGEVTSCP
jgi:hypothetical protein